MLHTYNWNQTQSFQSTYLQKQKCLLAYLKTGKSFLPCRDKPILKKPNKPWADTSLCLLFSYSCSVDLNILLWECSLVYYIHVFTNPVKNLTHKLEAEQNLSVKYTTGRRMRAQHSHSCMKRFGSFRWLCDSLIYLWLLGARSASYTGHWIKVKEIELRKHSSYAPGGQRCPQVSSTTPKSA